MHITADDLIGVLRSEDLRITEPRRLVCEVIATRHAEHLTAAAIIEAVASETGGSVDRATVYRTLDVLEEAGAIKHGHIGHGPTVYHLAEESDHQHLVCQSCHRTVAIQASDLAPLLTEIESSTGFTVDIEHFALSGLCVDCTAAEKRGARS
jgi:Fur family transcriptional regulator, ferric uptake regulator